ncbi:pentatricopeptide repeat-containing protein At5g43790 isoform X2 [Hevea brasiliensis]|uniref:pentatricopeptide repeat-containing protein At5g43790 isoform X2 n=1 Tax=Hevea brasiliensis TaxID=3981 RepID=UPI0025E47718|nr:pentatricopeptide repeat-containing protein At5g43790 isoform X2 [Hevea brasiliensis]
MKSPNPVFTHPILQLLQKCRTLDTLKQIHAQMIATGLTLHTYPLSRLLLFSSTLNITYTLSVFNQIPNSTIFLFNTLISSLVNQKHHTHIAFSLYRRILSHKTVKPNSYTYPSLFKACGLHPWVHHGLALHTHVLKFLEPTYDHFVQASLLNYYANSGKLGVARYLFDQISKPDLATWNSILAAYASAWAHAYILKNNLRLNRYVGTAFIGMYSKCGCIGLAYQLFDRLSQRDTSCYNSMIGGLAIHGYGHRALDLYEKMKREGLAPDHITFVVTMCACSHIGSVDEGCKIFDSIKEIYGIEPTLEHYGCVIDLLGRAGQLTEAEEKMRNMPMKPNAILWRSLLGAARVHGNLEIGEVALKHLMELEPETSGNYVLLSNMYAGINKWEDVKKIRKLMKDQGIIKIPGSSLVEMGGAMHEFITGDKTHPLSEEIYLKLEEINRRLQEYGHKPRIKEVLFDIEEEEKEDALSYHSERLAIAFALIAADSSAPIRIIKNLRICGDCHASTKLISMIYGRQIIVRDRNRFHHFNDGTCSCLDYW